MGLVINPTAFRIGHVKAWTDAWYLHRMHYPVFVHKSLEIKTLLQYVLSRKYPSHWSRWVYSHTTYYYAQNRFYINLFVYDGHDSYNYYSLARDQKRGTFRKSKFKRFWTKKQLLDQQFLYQRWFLLLQALNFSIDDLNLDNIAWRLKKRQVNKIWGLKRKYGQSWTSREEILLWRFSIMSIARRKFNYSKVGIPYLYSMYKYYILPFIKYTFKNEEDHGVIDTAFEVVKSHKMLYIFFSYFDRIVKYIPSYPSGVFNKFTYKFFYRFFRMYFVFKPYWINLAKLYELVLLYINVNSKIKIYLLDNIHLSAAYISRYIMTCLRLNFDYRDTMIPIRKSLYKTMFSRRWKSHRDFLKKHWSKFKARYLFHVKDRKYFYISRNGLAVLSIKRYFYRIWRIFKTVKRVFKYFGRDYDFSANEFPVNRHFKKTIIPFSKRFPSLKKYYKRGEKPNKKVSYERKVSFERKIPKFPFERKISKGTFDKKRSLDNKRLLSKKRFFDKKRLLSNKLSVEKKFPIKKANFIENKKSMFPNSKKDNYKFIFFFDYTALWDILLLKKNVNCDLFCKRKFLNFNILKNWNKIRFFEKNILNFNNNVKNKLDKYELNWKNKLNFEIKNRQLLLKKYNIKNISEIKSKFLNKNKGLNNKLKNLNINFNGFNSRFMYLFDVKKELKNEKKYIYGKKLLFLRNKYFNKLLSLKKKYWIRLKIFFFKIRKYLIIKKTIFSFIMLMNNAKRFSIFKHNIVTPLYEKFYRLKLKSFYWYKKRRKKARQIVNGMKWKLQRLNKTKFSPRKNFPGIKDNHIPITWKFFKRLTFNRWAYSRIKRKFWRYKQFVLEDENVLSLKKRKLSLKNFFFFKPEVSYMLFLTYNMKKILVSPYKEVNNFLFFTHPSKKWSNPTKYLNSTLLNYRIFMNTLRRYSSFYKPFVFNVKEYKHYISRVMEIKDINEHFPVKQPKKYGLLESPLKDKFKRLRTLEGGNNSLLLGYKFHFVGRFTRKQKAASLWFAKGANSVSSMKVDIDYGYYTVALRYSACTLKVWLYRNKGYSFKYGYRLV